VIRGSAVNQDGRSSGFTAPNVLAQVALIEAALADAGLAPADIGLVEAHGTGTALGDPIEMEAIVEAIGRKSAGMKQYVGSVKANLGHLEAAAGIAGLLKVVACCANRSIPPLVHLRTLNPRIDLAGTRIELPTSLVPWTPGESGPFAGVSSFGLSGTNAHVIVGPSVAGEPCAPHAASGFELTARTPEALRLLAARFRDSLTSLPDSDYGAFAYTATFGRARQRIRARIAAATRPAAIAALDALADNEPCAAVTLGPGDEPLAELPRRVALLPHYPWQREHHAPPFAAAEPPAQVAPVRVAAAGVASADVAPAVPPALPGGAGDARDEVRRRVAALLGHEDATSVQEDANLFDLGLDSLIAVDLARELSLAFAVEISLGHVFDHATVRDLAAVIAACAASGASATPAAGSAPRPAAPPAPPAPPAASEADGSNDIARAAAMRARPAARARRAPRVAFLFSCTGSQYFGMGRELYDTEPVFRARIDACDRVLAPLLGVSLREVMMHGDDPSAIQQVRVTLPALVALELALADLWNSWGVTASAVMGHSVGEIAAAIHAGVIEFEPGLRMSAERGRLMQSTAPGAMLAVKAPMARVAGWLEGTGLDVAAINGPEAVVLSGARDAIDVLTARLRDGGVAAQRLAVSHASHSRLMESVVDELNEVVAELAYRAPALPIIANLTGRLAANDEYDARYWCRHLREPVRFHEGARALRALDIDVCLEIGPDRALVNLTGAAELLPAGGGVPSLRRGAGDRATMLAAVERLHELGQAFRSSGAPAVQEARVKPRASHLSSVPMPAGDPGHEASARRGDAAARVEEKQPALESPRDALAAALADYMAETAAGSCRAGRRVA
jgi:acyl transferase domain-containing protein